VRSLVPGASTRVRDSARVGFLLASSYVAVHRGQRRGDPGLQARLVASLLARGST